MNALQALHACLIRTRSFQGPGITRPPEIPPGHCLTPHQTHRPILLRPLGGILAQGHHSAERTQVYFDALGRSSSIADWQFCQALDAARILACDVLAIPWAASFPWQSLGDQARSLEPGHRTLARETIQARTELPILQPQSLKLPSHSAI